MAPSIVQRQHQHATDNAQKGSAATWLGASGSAATGLGDWLTMHAACWWHDRCHEILGCACFSAPHARHSATMRALNPSDTELGYRSLGKTSVSNV